MSVTQSERNYPIKAEREREGITELERLLRGKVDSSHSYLLFSCNLYTVISIKGESKVKPVLHFVKLSLYQSTVA